MLNIPTHKNFFLQILKEIYSDPKIGPILGFKGGTAAYLFYDLNRFSTDLDFDLLDPSKEDEVFSRMVNILANFGIIKESHKKKYTLFFVASYEEKSRNIKVEINRRNFGSKYEIKNYLGVSMLVMVKEDMFANKLAALVEREGTRRDIFDVYFFLKNNWPINEEIIEKRTKLSVEKFLRKGISVLKKINENRILEGIGEILDAKQKIWAKANLKKETLFLLKLRLETSYPKSKITNK